MVSEKAVRQLIKDYHKKKWFSRSGDFLNSKCHLSRVKLPSKSSTESQNSSAEKERSKISEESQISSPEKEKAKTADETPLAFLNRKQKRERAQRELATSRERKVAFAEFRALPELNPPDGMPRGNVGTPRDELLALMAKLPTSALKRLGNPFGKPKRSDNYSEVAYQYGDDIESRYAHVNESDSEPEEWDRHEAAQPLKEVRTV